jgi:hypothetical protein
MLDRGEQLDWFGSGEIVTEAIIGASATTFTQFSTGVLRRQKRELLRCRRARRFRCHEISKE